jgi:hypothetical protein
LEAVYSLDLHILQDRLAKPLLKQPPQQRALAAVRRYNAYFQPQLRRLTLHACCCCCCQCCCSHAPHFTVQCYGHARLEFVFGAFAATSSKAFPASADVIHYVRQQDAAAGCGSTTNCCCCRVEPGARSLQH